MMWQALKRSIKSQKFQLYIYIYIYITLLEIYFIFSRLNISLSPPYYFFQLILYFPHPEHDIIYI